MGVQGCCLNAHNLREESKPYKAQYGPILVNPLNPNNICNQKPWVQNSPILKTLESANQHHETSGRERNNRGLQQAPQIRGQQHQQNRPGGPEQNPGRYCFRMQKNRVYYVSESLVKRATNVKRDKLVSLGTQIGKFTKTGKFFLTIQSLNLLAANAKHKVWLKPTSEMSFLYGNSVLKGGLGRITENIQVNDGVVVFSMSDVPLGFGDAAKSTVDCRKMDPNGIVVHRHADIGEYLRMEDDL